MVIEDFRLKMGLWVEEKGRVEENDRDCIGMGARGGERFKIIFFFNLLVFHFL